MDSILSCFLWFSSCRTCHLKHVTDCGEAISKGQQSPNSYIFMEVSANEFSEDIFSDADKGFTIAFEAMKDLVLSRAWSKKDYDDMTIKIEGIRSSIVKNCHIPLLARQPALTEDIFLKLLDNPSDESAFMGFSLYDLLTMDIE